MLEISKCLVAAALSVLATGALAETSIKIGYTSLGDNVADFVAIDKGFFEKHGIKAEAVALRNGAVIAPGLISGEIQIGTMAAPILVQALDGGLQLKVLTNLSVLTEEDKTAGLIVRTDSGIEAAADLDGKVIGVGSIGSMISVATKEWMRQNGLDITNVKAIETPMPQLGDTLRNKNIDFTTLPEPLLARALAGGELKQIANPMAELPAGKPIMINVVSADWAAKNPEVVENARKAIEEAAAWARDNQAEAQAIVAKYLQIDPAVVAKSGFPKVETTLKVEDLAWWAEAMKAQSMLRTEPDLEGAFIK